MKPCIKHTYHLVNNRYYLTGEPVEEGADYDDDCEWVTEEKKFIMFDVTVGETFLKREDIEEIAKAFNVETVPVALEGTIQQAIDYIKTKPNSIITKEIKEMEGVVGVPKARLTDFRGNRIIVKVKVCDFTN